MACKHDGNKTGHVARLVRTWGLAFAVCTFAVAVNACLPPPDTLVRNAETGEPIDLQSIDAILQNGNLTTEEKQERLLELGVPEDLIPILLNG
jgi:hypothetical protein